MQHTVLVLILTPVVLIPTLWCWSQHSGADPNTVVLIPIHTSCADPNTLVVLIPTP